MLILLRHEERDEDISYESPLTNNGKFNSRYKVVNNLLEYSIDEIYCSPFIRTMETIQPYCEKTGKKINIEWCLAESIPEREPVIDNKFISIINDTYIPCMTHREILYHGFFGIRKRLCEFLRSLDKNKNILLVTHMPIINVILILNGHEDMNIYSYHDYGAIITIP